VSDPGSGALDSVKEAFQGKRGKILLVGGAAAIAVYVWWTRRNGTPETTADPTDTTDTTGDVGGGGTSPQSDPTVGNQTVGAGSRKYDNNEEWLSDATDFLSGRGVPSGSAYNALNKALGGQQLTAQEQAWVSQVIGALGAPPEGMPPLNSSPPASTGSVALKAPANLKVTKTTTTSITLDWAETPGAKGYKLLVNGKQNGSSVLYSGGTVRYLTKNTHYTIGVQAIGGGDKLGPIATISAQTKSK
jgi:hypothetical protein